MKIHDFRRSSWGWNARGGIHTMDAEREYAGSLKCAIGSGVAAGDFLDLGHKGEGTGARIIFPVVSVRYYHNPPDMWDAELGPAQYHPDEIP